ncbi:hypothetical protein Thiowin_03020 [Thiorhodovibrio winogradskyi]|uniref:Uncharacterized protein n=1 Tax=Thiorhodovibrio winogradskyi TaxID=77007 RepID=A0ABZ0SAR8_9GAMM|nr:hypothetical protein [Thiorhodovibrio winogradskyi]
MWTDPIVEELHRVREAHAARFGNDLQAIAQELRRIEHLYPERIINPGPRQPANSSTHQNLHQDFDQAANHVLTKNRELYQRLD